MDEVHLYDLKLFNALVVVLPTAGEGERSLDRFVEVIRAYRVRRPDGLNKLLGGTRKWYEVGVVQVFDDDTAHPRPAIQSIRNAVCRYEPVHCDADLTPFAAYRDAEPAAAAPTTEPASDLAVVRESVTAWGVRWRLDEVAEVRQVVHRQRDVYENLRFHDLRRPVPDDPRNRYDFVLDDPTYRPDPRVCDPTKWSAGGQRVVKKALGALRHRFPDVRRPPERDGKKLLQKEFHEFYRALCVAEELLRSLAE